MTTQQEALQQEDAQPPRVKGELAGVEPDRTTMDEEPARQKCTGSSGTRPSSAGPQWIAGPFQNSRPTHLQGWAYYAGSSKQLPNKAGYTVGNFFTFFIIERNLPFLIIERKYFLDDLNRDKTTWLRRSSLQGCVDTLVRVVPWEGECQTVARTPIIGGVTERRPDRGDYRRTPQT